MTGLKELCTPAYVYLVMSVISLIILTLQNMGHSNKYCIGHYMCDVGNTYIIFVIKILYILFWTWLLNVICRGGATSFAWLLVFIVRTLEKVVYLTKTNVENTAEGEVLDTLGLTNACCRRHMLTHVDIH